MPGSLKNLCVKTIVREFERYYVAFTTSKDFRVKRQFEFLQRKYSAEILSMFPDRNRQEKYLDVLVNKYLTVLYTNWFKNSSWDAVVAKVSEIGENIEKIYFPHVDLMEYMGEELPWHDIICYLPNLKFLVFLSKCNDLILKHTAKFCPNIEEIDIKGSAITYESIGYLSKRQNGKSFCSKLKRLYIEGTLIKDDDIKHLIINLPSLEIIDYPHLPHVIYSLHKNDLSLLGKVEPYNISKLNMLFYASSPYLTDLLKVCLSVCPHLKCLTCPILTQDHLSLFSKLSDLEKLTLECHSDMEIEGVTQIKVSDLIKSKGSKLISLTVDSCVVSLSVIIESCPRLEELNLSRVNFVCDNGSKSILHSLYSCTIEASKNDSLAVKAISILLSSSPNLQNISFIRCISILTSSEMKAHLLKYCEDHSILKLDFSYSVVEMQFVKDILLNCRSLKNLTLEYCNFKSDEEEELSQFAEILPNNPDIYFSDQLSFSDSTSEYENYDFEDDYDYDYDSYDDFDFDYYESEGDDDV